MIYHGGSNHLISIKIWSGSHNLTSNQYTAYFSFTHTQCLSFSVGDVFQHSWHLPIPKSGTARRPNIKRSMHRGSAENISPATRPYDFANPVCSGAHSLCDKLVGGEWFCRPGDTCTLDDDTQWTNCSLGLTHTRSTRQKILRQKALAQRRSCKLMSDNFES